MTSLKIVNHDLEICEKGDTNVGFMYKIELEKIKADLEVLNILDYRAVNIELFKEVMHDYKNNEEKALYSYNYCEHEYRKLTMEEFLKIKKFLLTNYEERVKELVGDSYD